ncbi:hypothetical protein ACHAWF_016895 [Thalassiosira exigua]
METICSLTRWVLGRVRGEEAEEREGDEVNVVNEASHQAAYVNHRLRLRGYAYRASEREFEPRLSTLDKAFFFAAISVPCCITTFAVLLIRLVAFVMKNVWNWLDNVLKSILHYVTETTWFKFGADTGWIMAALMMTIIVGIIPGMVTVAALEIFLPEETDIEMVMSQTAASRADAILALQNNGYDVVYAIMAFDEQDLESPESQTKRRRVSYESTDFDTASSLDPMPPLPPPPRQFDMSKNPDAANLDLVANENLSNDEYAAIAIARLEELRNPGYYANCTYFENDDKRIQESIDLVKQMMTAEGVIIITALCATWDGANLDEDCPSDRVCPSVETTLAAIRCVKQPGVLTKLWN